MFQNLSRQEARPRNGPRFFVGGDISGDRACHQEGVLVFSGTLLRVMGLKKHVIA
ncbi:hypothetical protein predicted by Glimmer/Critica [Acetobacter senegalensis]|uniref:Uncharacterized protein n=1 Tax=Acetobacter senegalensis TaxID=446692 RepID=A0A0U5B7Y4_9PROT|nr:hypothetical protein predicted by Glimmer/Critica [Acetobacter senegalensis]